MGAPANPSSSVDEAPGDDLASAQSVEFELCVEAPSGAFATYDTAPMSLRQSGETGGCPEL